MGCQTRQQGGWHVQQAQTPTTSNGMPSSTPSLDSKPVLTPLLYSRPELGMPTLLLDHTPTPMPRTLVMLVLSTQGTLTMLVLGTLGTAVRGTPGTLVMVGWWRSGHGHGK